MNVLQPGMFAHSLATDLRYLKKAFRVTAFDSEVFRHRRLMLHPLSNNCITDYPESYGIGNV